MKFLYAVSMDFRLDGRVALVTGASSGIGHAAALALAEAGAHVGVQGYSHMEEVEALADRIVKLGQWAIAVKADVSDAGDVDRLVRTVVDELGGVDIAFNNGRNLPDGRAGGHHGRHLEPPSGYERDRRVLVRSARWSSPTPWAGSGR